MVLLWSAVTLYCSKPLMAQVGVKVREAGKEEGERGTQDNNTAGTTAVGAFDSVTSLNLNNYAQQVLSVVMS